MSTLHKQKLLAILIIFAMLFTYSSVFAASGSQKPVCGGKDPEFTGYEALKIDPPDDGDYTQDDFEVSVWFSVYENTKAYLEWESNLPVKYVYVKGGSHDEEPENCIKTGNGNSGGYLYTYGNNATSDSGLTALLNKGNPQEISHVTFYYKIPDIVTKGSVKVTKTFTDGNTNLSGITFTLYDDGVQVGQDTTDSNGEVTFTNLTPGTAYTVVESGGPSNYTATYNPAGAFEVVADQTTNIGVSNAPDTVVTKGSVKVTKTFTDGNTNLSGITFTLYDDGVQVGQDTTDSNGEVTFTNLTPGTAYTVVESGGPSNYTATYNPAGAFEVVADQTTNIGVSNAPDTVVIKGSVQVTKSYTDETSPEGVTFTLYKGEVQVGSSQNTDSNGEVTFGNLTPGTNYTVVESGGPSGYTATYSPAGAFSVVADETTYVTVTNTREELQDITITLKKVWVSNSSSRPSGWKVEAYIPGEEDEILATLELDIDETTFEIAPGTIFSIKETGINNVANWSATGDLGDGFEPNEDTTYTITNTRTTGSNPRTPRTPTVLKVDPEQPTVQEIEIVPEEPETQPEPEVVEIVLEKPAAKPELPKTGGSGMLALALSGIMLTSGGLFLRRYGRK